MTASRLAVPTGVTGAAVGASGGSVVVDPAPLPVVDQAVTRLARRPMGPVDVHGLARAALRTGAPKLLDVLALRATEERYDASAIGAALDAGRGWPGRALAHPQEALALATTWAVGDPAWRDGRRARTAYGEILRALGPDVFRDAEQAASVWAQLAFLDGDREEVERLLGVLPLSAAESADLRIDLANPYAAGGPSDAPRWLEMFNARLREAGLSPVAIDPRAEHPFDGLHAAPPEAVDGPLVTVIVPSFRPDPAGLFNSLRSMQTQSYGNLEILLVDDASGPGFGAVYDEALALDPRIRLVRMRENGGSYLGRNEAISRSKGRFVTTQDSDDWSHPARMAAQVLALQQNPWAPASRSDAIRALDDLTLTWLGYPSRRRNASSFMVRRTTIATVGVFDTVRKGADSEYHERVERRLGPIVDTDTPLAITRLRGGSLSRSDFRMLWMTPDRALYRTSFRAWHDSITAATPPLDGAAQVRSRTFPASAAFRRALPGAPADRRSYDVAYLVDPAAPSALTEEPMRGLIISRDRMSCLVCQEDPTLGKPRRPNALAKAISPVLRGRIDMISASDVVSAKVLVVLTPGLLEMPSLDRPHVRADRIVALLPEPAAGVAADVLAMRDGARALFGVEIEWCAPTAESAQQWAIDLGEEAESLEEILASATPATPVAAAMPVTPVAAAIPVTPATPVAAVTPAEVAE